MTTQRHFMRRRSRDPGSFSLSLSTRFRTRLRPRRLARNRILFRKSPKGAISLGSGGRGRSYAERSNLTSSYEQLTVLDSAPIVRIVERAICSPHVAAGSRQLGSTFRELTANRVLGHSER